MENIRVEHAKFIQLFTGKKDTFGRHRYSEKNDANKKKRSGKSWTVSGELLNDKHYIDHLNGVMGLGIVPITNENKCKFVAIDIDIYEEKILVQICEAIDRHNIPLTVFSTKSGGLHLYLFFKNFVSVKDAHSILSTFRKLLALDIIYKINNKKGLEIFPKQAILRKGDNGNWLNLPYFNYKKNTRQVMIHNGMNLNLNDAIVKIEECKIYTLSEYKEYLYNLDYNDAPPCLQSMYFLKEDVEFRNNYLFCWGVYFNKKDENLFSENIHEMNNTLNEPLEETEVERTIIKSVLKKGYSYKCNDAPCATFCDKNECKKREYGIGNGGVISNLDFGKLKQVKIDPPYYVWSINEKELIFKDEEEILNQGKFSKICFRSLHYVPPTLKISEWKNIVNQALLDLEIILVDPQDDIGQTGIIKNLFSDFILDRPLAKDKYDLYLGKVYKQQNEQKIHYVFRPKDFVAYMDRKKISYIDQPIHAFLKNLGCEPVTIVFTNPDTNKKSSVRAWRIDKIYFDERKDFRVEKPQDVPFVVSENESVNQTLEDMI